MAKSNRLNLGCSGKMFEGWTNVDIDDYTTWLSVNKPGWNVEFVHDDMYQFLKTLPDESVEAIAMIHALDHLVPAAADLVLSECYRVLKPAGALRVEVEDFALIVNKWLNYALDEFIPDQPQQYKDAVNDERVAYLLFGNLSTTEVYHGHKMTYTKPSLYNVLGKANFKRIYGCDPGVSCIVGWDASMDTQPSHSIIVEAIK